MMPNLLEVIPIHSIKNSGAQMKNSRIYLLLFLMLIFKTGFSIIHSDDIHFGYCPIADYYSENLLGVEAAGRGYSGVAKAGGISSTFINPASLSMKTKLEFYYEFGFKNNIISPHESDYKKLKNNMSYGIAYNLNDTYNIALIFAKKASINEDFGTAVITDQFNHPLATFHDYYKKSVSTINLPVSFRLNEKLQLGVSFNLEIYNSKQPVFLTYENGEYNVFKGEADFVLFRPQIGAIYSPNKQLSIGSSFVFPNKKKIEDDLTWYKIKYKTNDFPWKLTTGINYNFSSLPLNISADYRHINTSVYENYNNRNDLMAGIEYKLNSHKFRLGYMTQFEYRELDTSNEDWEWMDGDSHSRHFLTAGASLVWKKLTISAAYMESNFLSSTEDEMRSLKVSASLAVDPIERNKRKPRRKRKS